MCAPRAELCTNNAVSRCDESGGWAPPAACPEARPLCSKTGEPRCVGVVDLIVGATHAAARFADGSVRSWGTNDAARLGDAHTEQTEESEQTEQTERTEQTEEGAESAATVDTEITAGFASFALGSRHGCGVNDDGAVMCWGANDFGQLGTGDLVSHEKPVAVSGLADVAERKVGANHSCARTGGGELWCWGKNDRGQLGRGTLGVSSAARVAGIADAEQLGVGEAFACARTRAGLVLCWGAGDRGQLGGGRTSDANSPVVIVW
ncbi:MAG: hypothetical protein EXR75_06590 [Myxococcales bacterium]|nr:hypothetical protein [Myxococcales bacterium]